MSIEFLCVPVSDVSCPGRSSMRSVVVPERTSRARELHDVRRSALQDLLDAVDLAVEKVDFDDAAPRLATVLSGSTVMRGVRDGSGGTAKQGVAISDGNRRPCIHAIVGGTRRPERCPSADSEGRR